MVKFVSDSEAEKINEMWRWYKDQRGNRPIQAEQSDTIFPPEVYFAKPTSASGIPGLAEGNEPGSEECDIYKLDNSDPPALVDAGFNKEIVYNISEAAIAQDWIEVRRTKYGSWFAVQVMQRACLISAQVNEVSNVAVSDTTFSIDNVVIIAPAGATTYPDGTQDDPTIVNNTFKVPALDDAVVIAWYNNADEDWEGLPALDTTVCP